MTKTRTASPLPQDDSTSSPNIITPNPVRSVKTNEQLYALCTVLCEARNIPEENAGQSCAVPDPVQVVALAGHRSRGQAAIRPDLSTVTDSIQIGPAQILTRTCVRPLLEDVCRALCITSTVHPI